MDASSTKTATLISKCVKPKKSKKGNLIGAAGASGGSGKAGGTSSIGATADSSNDTSASSVASGDNGGAAVTALGKGVLRSPKMGPGVVPICEELDQNGNIIDPGAETLAPGPGGAPSASVNSQPTGAPQPGGQPASNENSQPTFAPQPGDQPASNENSQPTAVPQTGDQPASNENSQPSVAPLPGDQPASNENSQPTVVPQPGDQPASNENVQPTVAPAPTVSSPTLASAALPSADVSQASVCDAYTAGTAPTTAPRQDHVIHITLDVDEGANQDFIYEQMGIVLRKEIAPLLLDCGSARRLGMRRQLQDTSTQFVNLVLNDPSRDTTGKISMFRDECTKTYVLIHC